MSLNSQPPQFFTITSGQTLTLDATRSVSVLASGGTATITNALGQVITIPASTTLEVNADSGNTLSTLIVTASSVAYVVVLSGQGTIT